MVVIPGPQVAVESLVLQLYVAGESPNSRRAIANLENLCQSCLVSSCQLEIIDVFLEPLRPLRDGILVTPTLVRISPLPSKKIVGDLSQRAKVLEALGLQEHLA